MSKDKQLEVVSKLEKELKRIKDKDFKVCFFIIDSKGNPVGSLSYIYETAFQLKEMGYNVQMLHQEKEFVGVGEWLGEKYASLPHFNIETDNVDISVADFLIIPEVFSNVMSQTKKLPCKRVALLQNFNYLTEFIPVGVSWGDLNMMDVITTSNQLSDLVKECFPYIRTHIVRPSIPAYFRSGIEPKKLIINIVSREQSDVNKIVKPFYWKYPIFKWVSFRDLRGMNKESFADALREAAITVWVDDMTNFGYSPIEAMKSGSIVIGKVPDMIPEWMLDKDGNFTDNGLWFDDINKVHELIANVVQSWINDEMPEALMENMNKMKDVYSVEEQRKDIEKVYVQGLFEQRRKELEIAVEQFKNKGGKSEKK